MALVGRSRELAGIDDALNGLRTARPFVTAFVGDEGSGRTTLVDESARRAREAGALVLATRGRAGGPPYGGLHALLRPLERQLDALSGPDLGPALRRALAMRGAPIDPIDVGLALLRAVTTVAEVQPTVVVVDDAAALDPASADTLVFMLGRLGLDPVGAVLSLPAGPTAFDAVLTLRWPLGPMSRADLAELLLAHPPCTPALAAACAGWADGSPLLAIELLRSFGDDERSGVVAMPPVPRDSVTSVQRWQQRLDELPEPIRRALVVVATERSGRLSVVAGALAALGEPEGGLDGAEAAGLVRMSTDPGDARVAFVHPLLRPLSSHLVAASSRRAAHRAVAAALAEPQDAAERAWHLVASCVGPDDEVAAALDLVATEARRRGAHGEAAEAGSRAATLSADPAAGARRRRAAAVDHLDGFDADGAIAVLAPLGVDDVEANVLLAEAIEQRDGAAAALAVADRLPAAVRADLALTLGDRAAAQHLATLGAPADDELAVVLHAALDPAASLTPAPAATGPIGRRALRRWLSTAASRGTAPPAPSSVDELLAAAEVAARAGDTVRRADLCARATAIVPVTAARVRATIEAVSTLAPAVPRDAAPAVDALAGLTNAERRVAESVAGGRTNREVADHLFVSVKTVDFHLQSIYRKLAVRSRTELAVLVAGSGERARAGSEP